MCGFYRSNGTLPFSLAGRSAPHVGDPSTRRWRGVSPGDEPVRTRLCLGSHSPGASRVPISRRPSALRRGGGGHSSMASGRCVRGAATAHSAVDHTQLGPSRPPTHQQRGRRAATASSAGRRLLPTTKTSAPPCAALPSACGFSHRGRGNGGTADNETAQALQHGCGDDCSRSASLAAPHARDRERCTES